MKTIKSSKEITTLVVGDVVVFGNLEYIVTQGPNCKRYYLSLNTHDNDRIFEILNLKKRDFVEKLGIDANCNYAFPETKSLEALTAIVVALFKEYEKQNELPKTWEEFCERIPIKGKETFINSASDLVTLKDYTDRTFRLCGDDKNLCTSKQEAEAFLALMQLRQLRKAYVKDWEPDWINGIMTNYCIEVNYNKLVIYTWNHKSHILSFPSRELAEQFLTNFKDLLEIAKPLL